jgi:hypothetical protein
MVPERAPTPGIVYATRHDSGRLLDVCLSPSRRSVPAVNEWAKHEIALRAERQRIERLFSGLVRAQPEPFHESCSYFTRWQSPKDDDPPTSDQDVCIVDVEIVVRHVTWHSGEGHPAAVRLQDAFDEYLAKNFIDPAWNRSTEFWITPDYDGTASLADGLSDLQHQCHYLVLGHPVESAGRQMNLESASVDVLAGIAAELALPGDTSIKNIKRMVQFTIIVVGIASGQPILANAGFKSWLHDFVTEAASQALKGKSTNTDVNQRLEAQAEVQEAQATDVNQRLEAQAEVAAAWIGSESSRSWQESADKLDQQDWEGRRDERLRQWDADDRAAEPDVDCSGGS